MIPPLALTALLVVAAYVVGAIPFALLIGKAKGIDIRAHGSGNVGATNVARVLGRGPGLLCFALDFGKGWAPVFAAGYLGAPHWAGLLAGVMAILGHSRSMFLRFSGGKSVATGAGVVVALAPAVGLATLALWGLTLALTRIVSVSSIVAAASLPLWMWGLGRPVEDIGFGLLAATFIIVRHRANLGRLMRGEEPRMGKRQA